MRKAPRRSPTRLRRWRAAHRERFGAWAAGTVALVLLLSFWVVVARQAAGGA